MIGVILLLSLIIITFFFIRSKPLYYILLILMIVLMGFSTENADIYAYKYYFERCNDFSDFEWIPFEKGYLLVTFLLKKIGLDFEQIRLVLSAAGLILISRVIKKNTKYVSLVLILYFICPFFPLDIIQIRNFLMEAIMLNFLVYFIENPQKNWKVFLIGIVVGAQFHIAAIYYLLYLLIIFEVSLLKKIVLIGTVLVGIIPVIINSLNIPFLSRMLIYFEFSGESLGSLRTIILVVASLGIFIISYYIYRKEETKEIDYYTKIIFKMHVIQIITIVLMILASFHHYRIIRNTLVLDYILYARYIEKNGIRIDKYFAISMGYFICGFLLSAINTFSEYTVVLENNDILGFLFQF